MHGWDWFICTSFKGDGIGDVQLPEEKDNSKNGRSNMIFKVKGT